MPPLVKRVMLPGLVSLLVAASMDALLAWAGRWPGFLHLGHDFVPLNWIWLLSLPLCGALGADLALRAGATVKGRIIAAALPSFAAAGLFAILATVELPMSFLTGQMTGINTYAVAAVLAFALWQVIVPGTMLVLGSLPFVIGTGRRAVQTSATS